MASSGSGQSSTFPGVREARAEAQADRRDQCGGSRPAVILVVRHSKDGALGIVLNRPMGRFALARLLESLGEKDPEAQGDVEVIAGGPVEPEAAFVIHTAEYNRSATIAIDGLVAVTPGKEIFCDIGQNTGPSKFLIAFGYAGWEPKQLESEMAHGVWLTAMADRALIFDEKRERLWEAALERRLRDL
jgi:putative transcriptional regulator